MNKQAQVGIGAITAIIVTFVAVIVGLALFNGGILANVGQTTLTNNIVNQTITFPAAGSTVTLTGQAATITRITNATNTVIPTSNYSITNYVLSNGELTSVLTANAGYYNSKLVNVTYVSEPFGYERSSGGRSVIVLIAIFSALAIAVIALSPNLRDLMKNLDFR